MARPKNKPLVRTKEVVVGDIALAASTIDQDQLAPDEVEPTKEDHQIGSPNNIGPTKKAGQSTAASAFDAKNLNEFLHQLHETSVVGESAKLPPLTDLKKLFKTKSAVIRHLVSKGYSIKDVAKHLNLRYQHVRNVATTALKRGPNENWTGIPTKASPIQEEGDDE